MAANYELQMLVYALAAEKILNCPPQELVLHFLRPGRETPFVWNEAARKRLMEMVQGAFVERLFVARLRCGPDVHNLNIQCSNC